MNLLSNMVYRQKGNIPLPFIIMDIDKIIGVNLKRLRLKAGLTQEVLAEKLKIQSSGLIPRWEAGTKGIGKDVMIRICKALNVQPYEFYIDDKTIVPATDLEKKALFMARAAESARLDYIAEEIVEYGSQRIERMKKEQKKAGADKGRTARLKAG